MLTLFFLDDSFLHSSIHPQQSPVLVSLMPNQCDGAALWEGKSATTLSYDLPLYCVINLQDKSNKKKPKEHITTLIRATLNVYD